MAEEIWVFIETVGERPLRVSLELLGKGRELAQSCGGRLAAVALGDKAIADELIAYGADRVYLIECPGLNLCQSDALAAVLAGLAAERRPEAVLIGATGLGGDLAARLAARLNTGLTAHCLDLYFAEDEGERKLIQVVPGWGGNLALEIVSLRRPAMVTVRPGVWSLPSPQPGRSGEIVEVKGGVSSRVRILEMACAEKEAELLESAPVVVAVGWGAYSAGVLDLARELAKLLGAPLAGTRPVVDKGLIPQENLLGHSGKSVAPDLIITLGASGAIHFTGGFLRAKVVLGVDRNPEAPIFESCDIGIVGDLREVLPLLIEEIKSLIT